MAVELLHDTQLQLNSAVARRCCATELQLSTSTSTEQDVQPDLFSDFGGLLEKHLFLGRTLLLRLVAFELFHDAQLQLNRAVERRCCATELQLSTSTAAQQSRMSNRTYLVISVAY